MQRLHENPLDAVIWEASQLGLAFLAHVGDAAPFGVFLRADFSYDGHMPAGANPTSGFGDLIEFVRINAMARSMGTEYVAAALALRLESPDGTQRAIGVYAETSAEVKSVVFPCSGSGRELRLMEPEPSAEPLLDVGLGFFRG